MLASVQAKFINYREGKGNHWLLSLGVEEQLRVLQIWVEEKFIILMFYRFFGSLVLVMRKLSTY